MSLLVVPVALLIGLSLGALGGGGSILTVPALVYVLGQDAHSATTASLVIVGATALAGAASHARAGNVRFGSGLVFSVLGVAGSFVGTRLAAGIDADVLLAAFAGLMLVAAGAMVARQRAARRRAALPAPAAVVAGVGASGTSGALSPPGLVASETAPSVSAARTGWRAAAVIVAAATTVGMITGFFGVGGGFVVVPALVLALGFDMPQAVGTSLLVIAVNSATALLARLGTPVHVDWLLVAVFTGIAMVGTVLGKGIAGATRPERLATAFTVLLVAVAVYTAVRSTAHLV